MLPNVIVIGAMKCGTTAVHRYLDAHPEIAMSDPKELNFFFGPDRASRSQAGNWHRGSGWYAAQFPDAAPVRGESSPGYTSPDHPEAAGRMAAVVPDVRLVYLVRDPVARAVSQYRHHRRDGTEHRSLEEALLDPASQYLSRGRYLERVQPFLAHFPRERIAVVAQEELAAAPARVVDSLVVHVGLDPELGHTAGSRTATAATTAHGPPGSAGSLAEVPARLQARLREALVDDADRFRSLLDRDLPGWSL